MSNETVCQQCWGKYIYFDGTLMNCPECGHVWNPGVIVAAVTEERVIHDVHGNILVDGDSVLILKDLRIKGSCQIVKAGTKVKNIRLVPDASDGHDISCKFPGIGTVNLKSKFVKKV